ncbi:MULTISPECIES: hypothetical protein [unclassified Clostridium]|uniref:hypothetical protein n=1 Tax=unclassified Clostridium TaxID=2614128 RepID=UPI0002986723|nr:MULTISPECIES: hypothetical protein [unclassified Clostridium]EKQ57247.1 MAG: hypothetical protein A370_01064 [Clostridium sp. Maddingley MBC34-26]
MEDNILLFYKCAGFLVNYYWNLDVKFYNTKECELLIRDDNVCNPESVKKALKKLYNKYSNEIILGNNLYTEAMKKVMDMKLRALNVQQFKDKYSFTYFNYCLHGDRLPLDEKTT